MNSETGQGVCELGDCLQPHVKHRSKAKRVAYVNGHS